MNYSRLISSITAICSLLLVFITSAMATPVIGIGSMYDVVTPGSQSMTKRIYNTGDSTAFVRVEIVEIHLENGKTPQEVPQQEISGTSLEKNRLIVTPQRLIIPPAGFQAVRVLWSGVREKERYFRVRFTPVMPEVEDSFGLSKSDVNEYRKNTLQAGLNVLTGYGTIVIIQPDKPVFNSVIDASSPTSITIKNNGNSTISLDNIRHCKSANTECGTVTREFILPGKVKSLDKKNGYITNFSLIEGSSKRALSY